MLTLHYITLCTREAYLPLVVVGDVHDGHQKGDDDQMKEEVGIFILGVDGYARVLNNSFFRAVSGERVFPHTLAVLKRLSDVFNKIIIITIITVVVVSKAYVCVWRRAVAHVVWGALRFVSYGGGLVCRWAGGLWGLVFGGCSLVWRGFVQVCGSSRRWSGGSVCCFGADSGSLHCIRHLTQQTRTTVVLDAGRVVIRCYNDVYGYIACLWWLTICG